MPPGWPPPGWTLAGRRPSHSTRTGGHPAGHALPARASKRPSLAKTVPLQASHSVPFVVVGSLPRSPAPGGRFHSPPSPPGGHVALSLARSVKTLAPRPVSARSGAKRECAGPACRVDRPPSPPGGEVALRSSTGQVSGSLSLAWRLGSPPARSAPIGCKLLLTHPPRANQRPPGVSTRLRRLPAAGYRPADIAPV